MHLKQSAIVAVMVVGFGAALGHQAHAAPAPDQYSGAADGHASNIEAKLKKGAVLDHIMVDPVNPGLIQPCIKVLRKYYKKAENHPEWVLRISITYYSGGAVKEKLVVVSLRDMVLTDHHPQPSNKQLRLVDTVVDISDHPIDPGTTATGTAVLLDEGQAITSFTFGDTSKRATLLP